MGQGDYRAIMYGITINKDLPEAIFDDFDKIKKEICGEGAYGVQTSYECDSKYIGLFIAINDAWLSKWWGIAFMENVIPDIMLSGYTLKFEDMAKTKFPAKYALAKTFWERKVKPILNKHNIGGEPKIYLIRDFD